MHCCSFSISNKLLQKGVRVHQRRVILMQKCNIFLGRGHGPLPRPLPQWGWGHPLPTPYPPRRRRRLDLNPSHSEILPTLLVLMWQLKGQRTVIIMSTSSSQVNWLIDLVSGFRCERLKVRQHVGQVSTQTSLQCKHN